MMRDVESETAFKSGDTMPASSQPTEVVGERYLWPEIVTQEAINGRKAGLREVVLTQNDMQRIVSMLVQDQLGQRRLRPSDRSRLEEAEKFWVRFYDAHDGASHDSQDLSDPLHPN